MCLWILLSYSANCSGVEPSGVQSTGGGHSDRLPELQPDAVEGDAASEGAANFPLGAGGNGLSHSHRGNRFLLFTQVKKLMISSLRIPQNCSSTSYVFVVLL